MGTKLERIAEISATTPKPEFTSLYHLINTEMLIQCHKGLDGKKAVGIDKVTKAEYEEHLEENIANLVERLKNKAYKPLPSLRVYIPKSNGKMRPLGIASYEDKIVQFAVKKILEAIYEPRFLNCMYGFRPDRGCHDAIKEVHHRLQNEWIFHVEAPPFPFAKVAKSCGFDTRSYSSSVRTFPRFPVVYNPRKNKGI